jgi:hypothetical protein
VRTRDLELLDGVMIDQEEMLLLVREKFDANLVTSSADFSAYALIHLKKSDADLALADYTPGDAPALPADPTDDPLAAACSDDIVEEALAGIGGGPLTTANAGLLARVLVDGGDRAALPQPLPHEDATIHWLCNATGRFDGGRAAWEEEGNEPCPLTSAVTYFLYDGAVDLREHDCQGALGDRCPEGDCDLSGVPGTCAELLASLSAEGTPNAAVLAPVWTCRDPTTGDADLDTIDCSVDRQHLTRDKLFYPPTAAGVPFQPLAVSIDDAFRYKSRFRSRQGSSLGFVPSVCALSSDILPYCYDPVAIEKLRARFDCLTALYDVETFEPDDDGPTNAMHTADRALIADALTQGFSFTSAGLGVPPFDGFERLYSELLIMKGDDALTRALGSRFDLAGASVALFEGDLFEPDGVRLSGGAGFEMNLLYQALQYYGLVLDRFNRLSPTLWAGLDTPANNVITLDSISTYFNRVILASTKKAEAASEIAVRYRSFNRPDLARRVIERMYTEAYLESISISQLMRRSISVLQSNEVDALRVELTNAQRKYRVALERMREGYQDITDEVTFFGDPPDLVPFPQAGNFDITAVDTLLQRAFETVAVAKEREDRALTLTRGFDTDAAQFQSELNRVANDFENQLGQLCGFFVGSDGRSYPAIPKYAPLTSLTAIQGNPCGLVDNGGIRDAVVQLDQAGLDLRVAIQQIRDITAEADTEQARAEAECAGRLDIATLRFDSAGEVVTIESAIKDLNYEIGQWNKTLAELDRDAAALTASAGAIDAAAGGVDACANVVEKPGTCLVGAVSAAITVSASVITATAAGVQASANEDISEKEETIAAKETEIANLQRGADYNAAIMECCLDDPFVEGTCASPGPMMIDSGARVDTILIGLKRAELGALRAELEVQLARGRLTQVRSQARRLIAQEEDTQQLLIDTTAARNDPNVRILKNSDVLDADKSFHDAQVDAFRATRVFEYYTAQTYAKKEELFLARLVGRGDHNLENYLIDLQRDFREFEQVFGRPSPRLIILSLKDDIFRIPKTDAAGAALRSDDRNAQFRERLASTSLLDARGYITVPFATTLDMTSPLTAIHKITGIEADLYGDSLGDRVARVYLTARGTGTVRSLDDELVFHRFPAITAVLNPLFNGNKVLEPEIYRDKRLLDRPLVNSTWELGFNLRDEYANADVNLNGLTDIKINFYYEDFTVLE